MHKIKDTPPDFISTHCAMAAAFILAKKVHPTIVGSVSIPLPFVQCYQNYSNGTLFSKHNISV